ncbi:MAG: enolase C-terminal domain-like protein [Nitrososphaerota archaeon]
MSKIKFKISGVEVIPINVPIDYFYASSLGIRGQSEFIIVKITTTDGFIGYGEASTEHNWLEGETQASVKYTIEKYISKILVKDEIKSLTLTLRKINDVVAGNLYAKAAIDIALHDLTCKYLEIPLYDYLGGIVRSEIPVKFNIPIIKTEEVASLSKIAKEKGFKTIKLKVGLNEKLDLLNVETIRTTTGSDTFIGVDANGAWNPKQAVKIIKQMEKYDLLFVEQPVPRWDMDGLAYVRRHVDTPIMADESICTLHDAIELIKRNAVDMFSVYVGKAGGIDGAGKILNIAEGAGIQCTIGSNIELGIGNAAKLHIAASSSCVTIAPDIAPWFYKEDVITPPLECVNGMIRVPEKAGLGINVDDEKIEKYRVWHV